MLAERFDILDKVRALHPGGLTTLSIGVGHGGKTLQECHQMARESIDIALGRGGDQAAVKTVDGFEFYGGISHGVEKRSHVRSRIIANALCDLIKRSDSVIIMGHRMSDLDAVAPPSACCASAKCAMCPRSSPSTARLRSLGRCSRLFLMQRGPRLYHTRSDARRHHAEYAADRRRYLPEAPAGKPADLRKVQARRRHRPSPHGGGPHRQPDADLP